MIDINETSPGKLLLLGTVPSVENAAPQLYQVHGEEIVVSRHAGTWCAFVNRCPHAGAPLADGVSGEGNVTCGRHGWAFDLLTGERVGNWGGSTRFSLEMRTVIEQEGMLYLKETAPQVETIGKGYVIRFGLPGWVSKFRGPEELTLSLRDRVLIRTERGVEEGELLSISPREKLTDSMGELLRVLTEADTTQRADLKQRAEQALESARQSGQERGLAQVFVDAEALWDGETVIVYYLGNHGLELADVAESILLDSAARIQFQPLIDPTESGGCGCGSGGCHS